MQAIHLNTWVVKPIGPHVVPTLPLALLIAINLLPIVGAYQFGWNLFALLLLYWGENAIIGLYTIPKMFKASKQGELGKSRSYQAIFFVAHYSTFWVLHGAVLTTLLQMAGSHAQGVGVLYFATLALYAVQHGVSHRLNWLQRAEFERVSSTDTMMLPYLRVTGVLILTLVGGIVIWQMGEPPIGLALFAALKLVVDAASYVIIHRRLLAPDGSPAE